MLAGFLSLWEKIIVQLWYMYYSYDDVSRVMLTRYYENNRLTKMLPLSPLVSSQSEALEPMIGGWSKGFPSTSLLFGKSKTFRTF